MLTFTITLRPIGRGRYEAYHGSMLLCVSTEPLCDASRELLNLGYAQSRDLIEMFHEGSASCSLRSQVGKAARLTVKEDGVKGTRFTRSDFKVARSPVCASNYMPMGTPTCA